ncbi:hypothetical protein OCU04_003716 [Sclerotinia nivalis]|uniref:Uncharacterized protein n=1 Tax=Sclerotinia nivalis TaxID=352851 RepID=A0A9X0DN02_9HELO|nr:hypothetical protein OCU04_003716 [Sclerotinia nivalis]
MDKIDRPARLKAVNRMKGLSEVLAPERYLERGNAVLLANQTALNMDPRRDIQYPDWNIRYVNNPGGHGKETPECQEEDAMGFIFSDPELQLDGPGDHWSEYNFCTRIFDETEKAGMNLAETSGCIAEINVSVKTGTMIVKYQDVKADWDPDTDNARLYSSELMYQAWRDACTVHLTRNPGESHVRKLKYVIIDNIINQGTLWTIQDVLVSQGISPVSLLAGKKAKISYSITSGDNNICSDEFKMLLGTANGRTVVRMCADHAQTLGKQVKKIYAWYHYPQERAGALVFELEEVEPPARQSNLPKEKQSKSEKVKSFGKSVMGSITKRL